MTEIDFAEIDIGIKEMVNLFISNGFETLQSCQGGPGHAWRHPTIQLLVKGNYYRFRNKIADFLHRNYIDNFTISLLTVYLSALNNGERVKCIDVVNVEFNGFSSIA